MLSYLKGLDMLKPNNVGVARGTAKLAADDPDAWKGLANLRAFFVDQVYADGESEREPGCLIVKATSQGWLWLLKEPSQALMLRVQGRTWDEACLIADAFLGDPEAPWEIDPYEAGRRAKKKSR